MHLKIKTVVRQNYLKVKEGFTEELFLSLNPPFPPVALKEFGGCKKNDIVHLRLNFILFKQDWISEITYDRTNHETFEFIDEGKKLPFFLKAWKHHHFVNNRGDELSEIVDEIHFKTPFILMDYLMYPILWLQFAYRRPIYRKLFNQVKSA